MPISLNERNIMRETIGTLAGTEPLAAEVLLLLDALDEKDKEIERRKIALQDIKEDAKTMREQFVREHDFGRDLISVDWALAKLDYYCQYPEPTTEDTKGGDAE